MAKKTATKKTSKFSIKTLVASLDGPADRLGNARAVTIVCHCAKTVPGNLARTLEQLGVNGTSFQTCVFNQVKNAGFTIGTNKIPNGPTTRLIDVVNVIQNAEP